MGSQRISVTALRRKYPRPRKALEGTPGVKGEYCVGGALCQEIGMDSTFNFPATSWVFEALKKANPRLSGLPDKQYSEVYGKAIKLTHANDHGDFKTAWKILGELLRWKP